MDNTKRPHNFVQQAVARYLLDHPNEDIPGRLLIEATGGAQNSVSSAIYKLMRRDGWVITKPSKASYKYHGVGHTINGMPLSQPTKPTGEVVWENPPEATPSVAPDPFVPTVPTVEPTVLPVLALGDVLEVSYITRSGTVYAEASNGRTYRISAKELEA